MDENIVAIFCADETKTFLLIEPLDSSFRHVKKILHRLKESLCKHKIGKSTP
jgi:hypothetical protein